MTLSMGTDGHIAGILPNSPALLSTELAVYYKGSDCKRITLCADTIAAHCDEAVLCAFGEAKHAALKQPYKYSDNREQVPAMLLYGVSNCTVFNDNIEGDKV